MATKFSDFTAQAATATAFVVGYDGSTNTQYSQTQLIDFVFGGTLGQNNTLTLGGYQINLSQGGSGNFLYMNGTSANAYFLQGRYNGQAKASLGLNTGSGRLELWHAGTTKYIDLNPQGYVNYLLANTSIGANSGTPPAKLHVKGQGTTNATTAFLVEDSSGNDIIKALDDRTIGLGYNGVQITNSVSGNESVRISDISGAPLLKVGVSSGSAAKINICNGYFNTFDYTAVGGMVYTNAAGVNVSQDAASMFTLISTNKGMLPPRMTTAQRDAINSGTFTTGLTLYNTTTNKLQFYNGSAWQDAAGGDNIYTADGTIDEDRVITVGHPTADPKNTYVTTFESNKTVGGQNSQKNISGTQIAIKERVNNLPGSYSQTRGAVLKLQHTNTTGSANTEGYVQAFTVNSGGSDYTTRDQMGFRTNKAFVFQATDTSWPLYFAVRGGSSNNYKTLKYSGASDGGLFQLQSGNARTTKFTISDAGTHYKYIEALNTGKFELGRKTTSSGSDEAFITMNGIGSYSGDIGVGINQGTPTATLHVTGSGATSSTTSLLVENSNGNDLLSIKDDGTFALGLGAITTISSQVAIGQTADASGSFDIAIGYASNANGGGSVAIGRSTNTSANGIAIGFANSAGANGIAMGQSSIATGSGVAIGAGALAPTQSIGLGAYAKGTGANSITLNANGSNVTPSTANEFGVYMTSNTTPDFRVIGNEGMIPPSITTTVRDAISSPALGSTIYNTTNNKLQFYNGSAWTDAGGGGDSIYTADGNIVATRTINDRAGGFTGTAGNHALKMNIRNSGALIVAGYQNNGDPGTANNCFRWGPGATNGSMSVRGNLALSGGGGAISLIASNGNQYLSISQTGVSFNTTGNQEYLAPAIGFGTSASTNYRVRIKGATSTSTGYSLQVQNSSNDEMLSIRDDGAITIGKSATTNGATSVSIGDGAAASSVYGVAIGRLVSIGSSASYSTVIGNQAATTSSQNVAIGAYSAVGFKGTSVGYGASGSGQYAINLGHDADGSANRSVTVNASSGTATPSTEYEFGVYMSDASTPDFRILHDGNSYITGTGNFGIGITNPTDRLQVPTTMGVQGDGTNAGQLKLYCDAGTAHHVAIEGPAHLNAGPSYTIKLPNTGPSAGQVLESDANGNLSWKSPHELDFSNLPTSDPGVEGRLYSDEGTVKVSIP
tara:strand:+ start:840 stop:4376 length:3537 start_codon:yes stop_codon:yes gene_type:complete